MTSYLKLYKHHQQTDNQGNNLLLYKWCYLSIISLSDISYHKGPVAPTELKDKVNLSKFMCYENMTVP